MDPLRLPKFTLTADEIVPATWQRSARVLIIVDVLLGVLAADLYRSYVKVGAPVSLAILVLIPVLAILYHRYSAVPRNVAKFIRSGAVPEREVTLDVEGIKISYSTGMATQVPWSVIRRVESKWGLFNFHIPGVVVLSIPRRILTQEAEYQLVDLLRKKEVMV